MIVDLLTAGDRHDQHGFPLFVEVVVGNNQGGPDLTDLVAGINPATKMIKNQEQLEAAGRKSYGNGQCPVLGVEMVWDQGEKDCSDAYRVAGWTL